SLDTAFNSLNTTTGVFASGIGIGAAISDLAVQADGKILLGGGLGSNTLTPAVNSTRAIARFNSDGSRDPGFDTPFILNQGTGLVLQPDGKVVIVGTFRFTSPAVRNSIARLNSDGTLDFTFDTPGMKGDVYAVNSNTEVDAVALLAQGNVVVAGGFDNYKSVPAEGILKINANGNRDLSFESNGAGSHGRVHALVRQPDGKLLVGYDPFSAISRATKLNTARRGGIGRLNADGTTDSTFTSPFDPDSVVLGIALQSDGKILVGGNARLIDSQSVIEFTRLNADGAIDTGFLPPSGGSLHLSQAFAIQADGKILVSERNGSEGSLGRLNADGSVDNSFSAVFGFGAGVDHIVIQPDGRIIVSGSFTGANGSAARIGRLNANGSLDPSFDPGSGPDNQVRALILQPDGRVVIGGWFLNYNGIPRSSLARINANGSLDSSFVPVNIDTDQSQNPRHVGSLALQSDGMLLIGNEQEESVPPPNRVFRLKGDGSLDSSFALRSGIEGTDINALLLQPDNSLIVGGEFNVMNGIARLGLARLLTVTGSSSTPTPSPTVSPTPTSTPTPAPTPGAIQFSGPDFIASEGDFDALITITRVGGASTAASVYFQTVDDPAEVRCDDVVNNHGAAYARCDYASTGVTVSFAPGETQKTVDVPLNDDAFVEGPEIVHLRLSGRQGSTVGAPLSATLTILDNDVAVGPNPIDRPDSFVRQQYLDFLTREPEPTGFRSWAGLLYPCPDQFNNDPNTPSARCDRNIISSSFFRSQEFQLKGYFAFRLYRVAFGRLPTYTEIFADMQTVTGDTPEQVYLRKAALVDSFGQRPEFQTTYGSLSDADYVVALMQRYNLAAITTPNPANPDGADKVTFSRNDLVSQLNANGLTRGQVFRAIADSDEVKAAEYNRAFVAMQYYGYLRRTPEMDGYNSWLLYLEAHPADYRTMVNGFMNSVEYRLRFGNP
ncbi:MAG TPA: Calx-beta domain-containing protein, partial [Pyrinomonadaceae bacterium]|nr:Calx-beta domain-containing protein [Pyrinomonadaceae bacterium]